MGAGWSLAGVVQHCRPHSRVGDHAAILSCEEKLLIFIWFGLDDYTPHTNQETFLDSCVWILLLSIVSGSCFQLNALLGMCGVQV